MKHLYSRLRAAFGRYCPVPAHFTALVLLGLSALGAQAQQRTAPLLFQDDAAARNAAAQSPLKLALRQSRPLTLDRAAMQAALATAPLEGRAGAAPLLLALPLPDGGTGQFRVLEAPVMEPALAARYPSIRTYSGVGVDDPTATLRLDLTPQGFHAQVLSATTGGFYIDPVTRGNLTQVLSFWRRDMPGQPFACGVTGAGAGPTAAAAATAQRTTGPTLRTYRLAMAATGEYTAFQGGTKPAALAAIVTSVNRVVGVYEKELAVRLVLVANTDLVIYTNAATDPYANSSADLSTNQTVVDTNIGTANYDIGHVFSTASGGVAGLGVVCNPTRKAQGTTGTNSPVGDAFDIDYVAHEMGHQFGANHTFNSVTGSCNGNRNTAHAYEPGSGTTIMAYAGICGSDNTQLNSDAVFHVTSYEEIQTYLATTSCAASTSTGNNPPTVTLPASGKVLPIGTPFKLTASGADPDNNTVTYSWEEYDLGTSAALTDAQVANNAVPLFRSFYPTTSPTRYFPRLSDVIANTANSAERLPTVTRPLNFRVTLRDMFTPANTGMGPVGGVNSSATVSLSSVSTAGPFLVTAPNTALTWTGNTSQTVTWDVANTSAAPVSCALVNIRLSTDGGLTYPTLLLAGTPNDGSEAITVPSVATTTARVMVEAADNYFYDISNTNFTINSATVCPAPTSVAVGNVTLTSATVSFTGSGSATSYVVTTVPASTTQTVAAGPVSLTGLTPGTAYTVYVQSGCAAGAVSGAASATFSTLAPAVCNAPTNLVTSNVTTTSATVSFTASTSGPTSYTVTTSPATTTQTITGTSVNLTGLADGTSYTVSIQSNCADGGTGVATVSINTAIPNDECAGAITLISGTACTPTAGTVAGATQSQPASTCSTFTSPTARDVWYSFVASGPAHTVQLTSVFDGILQVFNGDCGSLTLNTCSDAATTNAAETVALAGLTANTRYYIRVYPFGATAPTAANSGFTICVTGAVAPTCAAPTALSASSVTTTTASVSFTANALGASYAVTTVPATPPQTVTASPVSFAGLTPNTLYTVSIATTCTNGVTSAPATVSFTTTAANQAPVVTTTSGNTPFTTGGGAVAVDNGLTVTDADNTTLASARVVIGTGFVSGQDALSFTPVTGVTGTYTFATGTLVITGTATVAQYQTMLRSVTYNNTSATPNTATRTLNFTANDGSLNSAVATKNVSFTATVVSIVRNGAAVTNAASVQYTVTFSAPVTGLTLSNFVVSFSGLTGPGTTANINGTGTTYVVTLSTGTGSGTLQLQLYYSTGISPTVTNVPFAGETYTIDRTAPTATISSTAGNPTSISPIPFTVTFSEAVTGFSVGGITVTNGAVTSALTTSGNAYSFNVTPTGPGTVTVSVAAGVAQDVAGNGNLAATPLSITYQPVSTNSVWTGALSTDWFTAGNWTAGVPTAAQDAIIIPSNFARQPVIGSGSALSRDLVINTGASLTMSGGTLDVRGDWANNSTFTATGGTVVLGTPAISPSSTFSSVVIVASPNIYGSSLTRFWNLTVQANGAQLSTAAGAAVRQALTLNGDFLTQGNPFTLLSSYAAGQPGDALVVNNSGVVVGTTTVQRAIDPSLNTGLGYRHYSAPVGNSTVADLATSGFAPVVNPTYNASATPNAETPFPTIFGYDESRVALSNNLSGFDKGYFSPAALTTALAVGRGYTVNINASETVDFQGTLNNNAITVPLSNQRATNAAGGWQLLGNPYPAPLDYRLIGTADRPNLEGAVYVFSSTTQYGGQYRTYNNGVGTIPIIPLGQGFFVRTQDNANTGSITFRNNQRLTAPAATTFQRTAETRPLLQLTLRNAAGTLADDAHLYFEQGATTGFESAFDAVKLPNATGLNLASVFAGKQLAINGLPLGASTITVPLFIGLPATGTYTLHAAELLNFAPGAQPFLRDLQLGTLTDLSAQPTYSFTMNAANTTPRFELVFGRQVLATASAALAAQVAVFPNPASKAVFIELPESLRRQAVTAALVDALGRTVRTQTLPAGLATHTLPLAGLAAGVYALRLSTSAGVVVKKLVVE